MTDLMYLLAYIVLFALLFMLACGIEWVWNWHEERQAEKRFKAWRDWK